MAELKVDLIVNDKGNIVIQKFGLEAQKAFYTASGTAQQYSAAVDKASASMRVLTSLSSASQAGFAKGVQGSLSGFADDLTAISQKGKIAGNVLSGFGNDLEELRRHTGLTEVEFGKLQRRLVATQATTAQENALKRLATQLNLTEKEVREMGAQFGLTAAQVNKVINPVDKASSSFFSWGNIARGTLTYLAISGVSQVAAFQVRL